MRRFFTCVLAAGLLLLLAAFSGPVQATEQILSYDVIVKVQKDGTLDVTERIRVNAEDNKIKHGIYRDFPVIYRSPSGYVRRVGFVVTGIDRDGHPEPWHEQALDRFVRIYIGDRDRYVSRGEHTYELHYLTNRQLRYFPDHDEIYWNATGNFWNFPILAATARIDLPQGARILSKAAYTGPFGARGKDWRIAAESDNSITFATTHMLGSGEGLTVAVGFPKGIVAEPSATELGIQSLWDNIGFVALIAAAVAAAVYFFLTWLRIGRDPRKGIIIPLFGPPDGMSPGVVSYIFYQGFSFIRSGVPRSFVAALMDMGVKGILKIVDNDGKIALQKLDLSYPKLSKAEAAIADRLFDGRDRVPFNKTYGSMLSDAVSRFQSAITGENAGVYFRNNYGAFAIGAGVSIVALLAFFFLQFPTSDQVGLTVATLIMSILGTLLFASGARRLLGWVPVGSSKIIGFILFVAGLVVLYFLLDSFVLADNTMPWPAQLAIAVLGIMNVSFFYLLRAPTREGRKIMDRIEGFKLYLSVAEEGRLNVDKVPDMSQQLFERFLPYAVALDVEKPWTRAFQKWLAVAHPEGFDDTYAPAWYTGRNFNVAALESATAGMVAGLSAGMVAAMPSQSSSGSSGGGSSGGGGGGGGGGGW